MNCLLLGLGMGWPSIVELSIGLNIYVFFKLFLLFPAMKILSLYNIALQSTTLSPNALELAVDQPNDALFQSYTIMSLAPFLLRSTEKNDQIYMLQFKLIDNHHEIEI